MTGIMIVILMINIILTVINLAVFYLTTKARRARRRVKIGGPSKINGNVALAPDARPVSK